MANQNIEIGLEGQLSLAKNKVEIDKTWSNFSSLNAPYLNSSLQPLFEKKEEYSDIVVDKYGNSYKKDALGNVYKNEQLITNVGTKSFNIETLNIDCIAYNNEGNSQAYIDSSYNCYFNETIHQVNIENVLHTRVRVFGDTAWFYFLYKDGVYYKQHILNITNNTVNDSIEEKTVSFGHMRNGTTWETAEDPEGIQTFQVNIAKVDDKVLFCLIGNNTINQIDKELYFFNSIYVNGTLYSGENVIWSASTQPITKTINLGETYKVTITQTKKRTTSRYITCYLVGSIYQDNPYTPTRVDGVDIPGGNQVYYPEGTDFQYGTYKAYTRTVGRSSTQTCYATPLYIATTTVTYTIKFERDPADYGEQTTLTFSSASGTRAVTIDANGRDKTNSWNISTTIPSTLVDDTTLINSDATISFKGLSVVMPHSYFKVDYVNDSYDRAGQPFSHTWTWQETITPDLPPVSCNMIEDDGVLRYVPVIDYKNVIGRYYIVKGAISSITENGDNTVTLSWYQKTYYNNTSTKYKKYAGASYNINQKYFSTCFSVREGDTLQSIHHLNYNTGMEDDFLLDAGGAYDGKKYYNDEGYLWYNSQGAISPLTENNNTFRLLYNYGNTIQGISYGQKNNIGTVLTDWASIDDTFYISATNTDVYFKDNNGTLTHISLVDSNIASWNTKIIENRFIVFNTDNYYNCFDIETNKMIHYASDFNGRAYAGWNASVFGYFTGSTSSYGDKFEKDESSSSVTFASGQNVNYEITGYPVSSSLTPANVLFHLVKGYESGIYIDNDEIDIYYQSQYSSTLYKNSVQYVKTQLSGNAKANYPVSSNSDVIYNIPLMGEILKTYNNRDMVKVGKTYYNIFYNNNAIVLLYNLNSMIENAESMFVIQSQHYAVINGKITSISFSNNTVSKLDAIIDVTGMKFIGYLPTMAFFFSPMTKVLYSFTGDANLTKLMDCQEISEVFGTYFDTSTQSIYIAADSGLYVISSNTYKIDIKDVKDIFFTENKDVIVKAKDNIHYISYNKKEGYEVIPLFLNTEFYAIDKNLDIYVNKCKLRFIKNEESNGTIKVSLVTLTDKGSETEEKEIKVNSNMWDKITDSFYVSYVPKYNKCNATQLRVTSDFPLSSLVFEVTPTGSTTEATRKGSI